ncbi:MAG: restriction endonuclease [Clostridium chrysemydis]|uniref:restriction endonuclease n=1 Tax=Clostridium chrysemydis TaxID=2665504 RepID=UPI003F2B1395
MANVSMDREEFKEEVKEIVGYKTGLNIQDEEIMKFLDDDSIKLWSGTSGAIRFRPEEYENIVHSILLNVGYTERDSPYISSRNVIMKYYDDEKRFNILQQVFLLRNKWWKRELDRCINNGEKGLNPIPFIKDAHSRYGEIGRKLAFEIIFDQMEYENCSPWNHVRRIEWKNIIELKDLFKSEGLETLYGSFIDQRYINYLSKNFENDIDSINWRKFEAITCEYFERNGYYVEIGEGRKDGGIDARIWSKEDSKENSPTILVQCKRQKRNVESVVVKALYADVFDKYAKSGLIVTSTKISPSGKEFAKTARGFKIDFCERDTLRKWIEEMRC